MGNNVQILGDFLDILTSTGFPIVYASVSALTLFTSAFLLYKFNFFPVVSPAFLRQRLVPKEFGSVIELYSDLNPDPLIRTNPSGEIIYHNSRARMLGGGSLLGRNVRMVLPGISAEVLREDISSNRSYSFTTKIKGRYYQVTACGSSYLDTEQFYLHDITERIESEKRLRTSEQKQRELSHKLLSVLEEERKRIAGELHDSIGQNLYLLKLEIQKKVSPRQSGNNEPDKMIRMTDTAINELKDVIFNLRPKILEEAGLKSATTSLINRTAETFGIYGRLFVDFENRRFNKSLEVSIYRIIQESINNIVRHAGASEYSINIFLKNKNIVIIISDNGDGFNPEEDREGFGLFNMKTRTEQYRGTMQIESVKGEGTSLIFNFPINE